ncbi:MAG: T9SS type A sorting domain-containing protein [Bacteroidetes bacterium]|nr:T9SS type A sorting domain-containing protein [Bacteroidota bacterium]
MKKTLLVLLVLTNFFLSAQANWTQTNGPAGGKINCLLTVSGTVYAGTPNGVFVSANSGASWTVKNNGLNANYNHTTVYSIAAIGTTIFIGTGEGVYSSTNQGNTWVDANGGIGNSLPSFPEIYSLVAKGTDLFAGLFTGGVYKTSDNGATWTQVNTGFPINKAVYSMVVMGSNLFAGTYGGGILISSNNGSTWSAVPDASMANTFIKCLGVNGTTLYASEVGTSGLLKSTNNGTTFTSSNNGFGMGSYVRSFVVSGSDIIVGTVSDGIYKSSNNGTSWTVSTTGLISSQICGIYALTISGSTILAGSEGCGIFKSTNNATSWSESNSNLFNTTINAIAMVGSTLFAGIEGVGIFKSTDDGVTWTNSTVGLPVYNVHTIEAIGSAIFAGYDIGVYKSLNNGVSWTPVENGLGGAGVYCLANDATYLYAGTNDGVYLTNNGGSSWTQSSTGLSSLATYDIAISGSSIYVAMDDGIYKSTNSAGTWTQVYQSFIPVTDIVINGTNVYAALSYGGALLSTNNGVSWAPINTGFPSINLVYSLTSVSSNIFAGTNDGVFRTSNGGTSWTGYSAGFPPGTFVNSLATGPASIYAGTDYGVWKNTLELSTQICIVTVDDISQHNVIVWEKAPVTNIDSFRVYREDVTGFYKYLASIGFNELSQYTDTDNTANPNFVNRRYKLQEKRTDGSLSPMSAYHNTILLQNNDSNFTWNPYQIEGQTNGFPVIQNKLMRDDNSSGVWHMIQSTAGSNGAIVASDYSLFPNARYRLDGDLGPLTCTPTMRTAAGINNTRSNIKNKAIGIREVSSFDAKISLQPNPAKDQVFVNYAIEVQSIKVLDYLGRFVYELKVDNAKAGSSQLNISDLQAGLYTIICKGKGFEVRKKLVVE